MIHRIRKIALAVAVGCCALALTACEGMITGGPLIKEGETPSRLQIINGAETDITVMLISRCSASTYGFNRLPDGATIPPGGAYTWTVAAGCWDTSAGWATGYTSWMEARKQVQIPPGATFRLTVYHPEQ